MKRFSFRLERVLEWRQGLLSLEEAKLQRLFGEAQALEREHRELRQSLDDVRHSAIASVTLQGEDLHALSRFHLKVNRTEIEIRIKQTDCDARIVQQRAACHEARRQVKLLETLREGKRSAWDRELDRELAQLAEESFTAKWVSQ